MDNKPTDKGEWMSVEDVRKISIGFAHWKDRHFKRTYPHTGYFYRLSDYGSVKLIPGVLYGEHYSFEQLYDMYVEPQNPFPHFQISKT